MSQVRAPGTSGHFRRAAVSASSLALAMVLVAGCSSSSKGGQSSAPANGGNSTLTGTTLKFLSILPLTGTGSVYPEMGESNKVAVSYLNAHGGVGGHPVSVDVCDDKNDPNELQTCARKAVSGKYIAVIGSYTTNGALLMPILNKSHIPYLPAGSAYSAEENASPLTFSPDNGTAVFRAQGALAAKECKKPAIVVIAVPTADFLVGQAKAGLKLAGKSAAKVIKISPTATDYSAQVAQAASGTDCFVMVTSEPPALAWYASMKAAGIKKKIIGYAGNSSSENAAKKFSDLLNGSSLVDTSPPLSDPRWKNYLAAFKQYSNPSKYNIGLLGAKEVWIDWLVLAEVGKTTPQMTSSTLLSALNKATAVTTGGLTPTLNFTEPAIPDTRSFNSTVVYETVTDGKIKPTDGKFYSALTGKPVGS